ncbi:nucleoside recognition domain-containing protein [Paenibacillus sp. GCM10012307]|uniref:Nucleoside recognition domain-containing protein n=1 Tax=Paenibacillus roseus TaxID=2798579 RepID=A0A934J829_9BACL|nr:nucleoside recognition domain-containing protein [Paenibacillus roseus]MBJ6363333.1 nucleoside recognition domain-containing protein [Paenibacillus roseus]
MLRTIILGVISLWLVTSIVRQPDGAFQAALQGLSVWWNIVFPGLLPFLVLSELMLAFGVVHALSSLLDPVMRRGAGMPGIAAWPVVLGWTAGYTAGAEATASLRKQQAISRREGQWLLAVSYMPNPMFMFIVIGAGFFHHPYLGAFIALAVWLSGIVNGVLLRLMPFGSAAQDDRSNKAEPKSRSTLQKAGIALMQGHREDGRSFGKVLGDSVSAGIQKLMLVGGFIIFSALLARLIAASLPDSLSILAFTGIYESHLGAYSASLLQSELGLATCIALISAVLCWGGLSGLLQVRSVISESDLKFLPFLLAKLLHALLAFGLTLLLWEPFHNWLQHSASGFHEEAFSTPFDNGLTLLPFPISVHDLPSLWQHIPTVIGILGASMMVLVIISYFVWIFGKRPGK